MKILVVAAHPDDEILGIAGTLMHHIANNDEVHVCIVTEATNPPWSDEYITQKGIEQCKVDEFLGITARHNLNLPTVQLNTMAHGELNKLVTEVIDSIRPDIIYTHFEHDLNLDHNLTYKAVLVGTRPPKRIKVLCYETLSESEWNGAPFKPNTFIELTKEMVIKKVKSFLIYESEVKEYPHPRSEVGIRILAERRGSEVCLRYAEALLLIRSVEGTDA